MPRMTISSMPRVWKIARDSSIAAASLPRSSAMLFAGGGAVKHQSILEYANFRWFKVAVGLSALAGFAYGLHEPSTKPYGGTALGYTLGAVAALLVLWLLAFGVRKRLYRSTAGTVQGWLSAHVYLGAALLVIATLHTGFELGWNVHTLAYVLMVLVVASGFYGVFVYLRVPGAMTENLGDETLESMLLRMADIDKDMREKALSLPDELFKLVERSVVATRLGGNPFRIVSGRDRGCPTARAARDLPELAKSLTGEPANVNREVYTLLLEKNEVLARARRAMRHKAILDLWLYFHVPLSIALLATLAVHVTTVFLYW